MRDTKHTPGPWEFRMYADGCTIVSKHDYPGSSVRAQLVGVAVKVDATIRDDQSNACEASADARLIVAAPELLEACKAMLADYEDQYGTDFCECDSSVNVTCNACRCRNAIAKGETI